MKSLGEFLREKRNTIGLSLREASQQTGVSHTHIRDILKSERLGNTKPVPVISWTQADYWREASEPTGEYEEYVEIDSNGAFALRVRGDSMEPEFYEGDIIIINPALKQEHNDYLVVSNEDGETTFKQLKKYGKTRVLHPLNPKYDDIELNRAIEYSIIGVVIEKKKKYR